MEVKDADGFDPTANATVVFSAFDGSNPERFETDAAGVADVDIPPGDYLVRTFFPNETGEQWFEKQLAIDPSDGPLILTRNLPQIGRRPELVAAEASPDGSAAYVPIGAPIELRIAIRYQGDAGPQTIAARATLLRGNTTLQDGIIGISTFDDAGWINGTLAASGSPPYYANESLTTLHVALYENGTTNLYDEAEAVTVLFRDGCSGDAVQLRVTLHGTMVPFCAAALDAAAWGAWSDEANTLILIQNGWARRFQGNATVWSFSETQAAWNAYLGETSPLRSNVTRRLDQAQTDESAFPTWQQIESLRTIVETNHTVIENQWITHANAQFQEEQSQAQMFRLQTLGLVLVVALTSGMATIGAAYLIIRGWKRRAEYWIGYSTRDQPTSPLWWTLLLSAAASVVGLAFTFASPLWSLLQGGA